MTSPRTTGRVLALALLFATISPPAGAGSAGAGPRLRGQVVAASGEGLAGAHVELLPLPSNFAAGLLTLAGHERPAPVAGGTSGPAGRFELAAPAPGLYVVFVTAAGRVPMHLQPLALVDGVDLPPVRLRRDAGAPLQVRAPGGGPQAGAWLFGETENGELWRDGEESAWTPAFRKALTDSAGRARLPRAEGETLRVTALASELTAGSVAGVGTGGAVVDLAAGRGREIEVSDGAGAPAAGVLVRTGPLAWPAGRTGPDGRLALAGPDDGRVFVALADAEGREGRFALDPADDAEAPTRLALPAARRLTGRVVDGETGAAVAGALVWSTADPGAFQRTDEEGRFRLAMPPGTRHVVRLAAAGYLPGRTEVGPAELTADRPVTLSLVAAARVTGRIADARGRPLAEARIELIELAADRQDPVLRVASGPGGGFELAPVRFAPFELRVAARGMARFVLRHRPSGGRRAIDLGTLVLSPEAIVAGVVVDPAGEPVAGAAVRAQAETGRRRRPPLGRPAAAAPDAVTDATGRFQIGGRAAGEPLTLLFTAAGYVAARLDGVRPPSDTPLRVVLEPGGTVRGRVLDETGAAVSGASVEIAGGARAQPGDSLSARPGVGRTASTDSEGAFAVAELPAGPATVRVVADGFPPTEPRPIEVSPTEEPPPLVFVLAGGAAVEGRVSTADGRPLAGVKVSGDEAVADSDGAGDYRLTGLPLGPIALTARHPERGELTRTIEVTPGVQRLDWTFAAGGEVAGWVVDDAGSGVAGAEVALRSFGAGGRRSVSGADGAFRLTSVSPGSYLLSAARDGFTESAPAVVTVAANEVVEGLEIALTRGATIAGRVLGLRTGELARVVVDARDAEGRERNGWVADDGSYAVEGLAAGAWLVTASLDSGRRAVSARVALAPGDRTALRDLEFRDGLTLSGSMSFRGAPLAGARLSLAGPLATAPPSRRTLLSDPAGEFRFTDLDPGTYRLEVSHAREQLVSSHGLELAGDEELHLELAAAAVRGRVVAADSGEPLAGAVVGLLHLVSAPGEGEFLLAAGTGDDGRFEIPRVPPGRYLLTARGAGYGPVEEEWEIAAGAEVEEIEIALSAVGTEPPVAPQEPVVASPATEPAVAGTGRGRF